MEQPVRIESEQLEPVENNRWSAFCKILKEESRELRWPVLLCACLLTFGGSYTMDFPGAFGTGKEHTIEQVFHAAGKPYTQSMNQFLYSVYSWPNTVLAIVGGLLIDKYLGLRRAMLLFSALVLIGSFLFFLGVWTHYYLLLVIGACLYGLGGESLGVAQFAFVARWFRNGRGISLAFGVCITFARLGSSLNFALSPVIALYGGVTVAALVGVVFCLFSLVMCVVLIQVDLYALRIGYIVEEAPVTVSVTADEDVEMMPDSTELTKSSVEIDVPVKTQPVRDHSIPDSLIDAQSSEIERKLSFTDILRLLPPAFWILSLICVCAYMSIYPFIGIAKNFFEKKYDYTSEYAGRAISAFQVTAALSSPLVGALVDKCGRNTLWLLFSCVSFGVIHILFIYSETPPSVLMIFMGTCSSFLVSGLWPSISLTTPEKVVGFAFGIMTSLQNLGFAVFPLLIGWIIDQRQTHIDDLNEPSDVENISAYIILEWLFILMASAGAVASAYLIVVDLSQGGFLTKSAANRERFSPIV